MKLSGLLDLGSNYNYEEFQQKLNEWIIENGWEFKNVGGIPIPDPSLNEIQSVSSAAVFHPKYNKDTEQKEWNKRYFLSRTWDPGLPILTAFMMNPSHANEYSGDDTVDFMVQYAKHNGFGALFVINTSTVIKPTGTKKEDFPIETENHKYIEFAVENADTVVLGWGGNGQKFGIPNLISKQFFLKLMRENHVKLNVLGYGNINKSKIFPRHPYPRMKKQRFTLDSPLIKVSDEQWAKLFRNTP
ncbi:DUF1643 domain-containing protein [Bacillus tropicus]